MGQKTMNRRSIFSFVVFTVLALIVSVAVTRESSQRMSQDSEDTDLKGRLAWRLGNARQAIDRGIEYFGSSGAVISAKLITLTEDDTPFLSQETIGRPLWKVTAENVRIELPSADPAFADLYERTFDIFLDAQSGKLVKIASRWPEGVPLMEGEPPVRIAEEQMRRSGREEYLGFPDSDPTITFLQTLDVILKDGVGSPFLAKQIKAHYVVRSFMDHEVGPVWAITLRGIPPIWTAYELPSYGRRHFRNLVDPRTGRWIGGTNVPGPLPQTSLTPGFPSSPPTVTLDLSSPSDGTVVAPGQPVEWMITVTVSSDDNLGLAMVAVNLVQDASNPELIEIPPGNRPSGMEDFDRPNGISNPKPGGSDSAYGGTPYGSPGAMDLLQIGGAQNTFGVVGDGIGLDTEVNAGVGQGQGQVIATGWFEAPSTHGDYVFSLESAIANVLEEVYPTPQFSRVRWAEVVYSEVQGGCGNCDEPHGGLGCSDPVCEAIVCGIDLLCCSWQWDELCADEALDYCDCDSANSPIEFTVAGSPYCACDCASPPNGEVDVVDFLAMLSEWGGPGVCDCAPPPNGVVDVQDFLHMLAAWGPCERPGSMGPPQSVTDCINRFGMEDPLLLEKCICAVEPEQCTE